MKARTRDDYSAANAGGSPAARRSPMWVTSSRVSVPEAAIISQSFVGHVTHTLPCRKGLGEEAPFRIDKAESCIDGDLGFTNRFEHSIDLLGEACDELGVVMSVDVETLVNGEQASNISLFDLPRVVLGVDDPNTRCSNGQVVDVGLRTGDLPIMEEYGAIPYRFDQVGCQAALARRSIGPGPGGLRIGRDELDLSLIHI